MKFTAKEKYLLHLLQKNKHKQFNTLVHEPLFNWDTIDFFIKAHLINTDCRIKHTNGIITCDNCYIQ